MPRQRVLITVKTYPTLSRSYGETVCTAGVREDGSWVRIYPVPFRRLGETEQYKKYDWIECDLHRNTSDPRFESFRPADLQQLHPVAHVDTSNNWQERRSLLLGKCRVHTRIEELVRAAKANKASLAVFKPTRILGFKWESEERDWSDDRVREMRALHNQPDLFEESAWRETFRLIPKLPYNFSYEFEDADGKKSKLQILDWEIDQLFWNCRRDSDGDEEQALAKVKQKYLDEFLGADLHFYLGTTQQYHFVAPNPWVIVGVLPIPHETQMDLFPA